MTDEADRDALRQACLDAANALTPMLPEGGPAFGIVWADLMTAVARAGGRRDSGAIPAMRRALDAAWRQPPDAFPGADAAVEWALRARPAMREALRRSGGPVGGEPGAPRPSTRNGRRVLDALAGGGRFTRTEIARLSGLWRGASNRAVDLLVAEGFLVVDGTGFRAA